MNQLDRIWSFNFFHLKCDGTCINNKATCVSTQYSVRLETINNISLIVLCRLYFYSFSVTSNSRKLAILFMNNKVILGKTKSPSDLILIMHI